MDKGVESEWKPLRPRMSRKDFDEALGLFKQYFNFVSMRQAVGMVNGDSPLIPNTCVVTFDDGHRNNITCALPILKKHQIPVILYPSTQFVETGGPYWFDRLDYAIQQPGLNGMTLDVGGTEIVVDQTSKRAIAATLSRLIRQLKKIEQPDSEFRKLVESFTAQMEGVSGKSLRQLKPGDNWSAAMTWQQIRDCVLSGEVEIGSHTVNHVRLSHADEQTVSYELSESRATIEAKTDKPCTFFCFPNGDWCMKAVRILKKTGYESAVTSDSGSNKVGDNPYLLKRFSVPNKGSALDALFTTTGLFHFKSKFFKKLFLFHDQKKLHKGDSDRLSGKVTPKSS